MSAEVQDWWDRAVRALETARMLIDEDADAASSRAYYAAFYAVSALFANEKRSFRKHTELEAAVHRDLVKPGKWSVELGAAFSFGKPPAYGDYGGASHVVAEEAQEAFEKAKAILEAVHGGASVAGDVGAASTENVFVDESPWDERPQGVLSEGSSSTRDLSQGYEVCRRRKRFWRPSRNLIQSRLETDVTRRSG